MENFMDAITEIGVGIGLLGLVIYPLSNLFRHKGHYRNGTGKPTGDYELTGGFNSDGKFEGSLNRKYDNGGYIPGPKYLIGRILGGIGYGLIAWTIAWWGLQFINCFSCLFSKDINSMANNENIFGFLAFIIGIIVGIFEFMDS